MIALTTAVAIAVTCSAIFMVSAVVVTILWVKIRQERRSLALVRAGQGPYAHGLQNLPSETLTELSREEGSVLRQYGQLPYGSASEWGFLPSRESLPQNTYDKSPISMLNRAHSISLKRSRSSKSKRNSKALARRGSLTTLAEASEPPRSLDVTESTEGLVVSAVDGALELPAETTPRQTPEKGDFQPNTNNTIRPISGPWPSSRQRERSSGLVPVAGDHYAAFNPTAARNRGGSITSQTAGAAPDQPVPPPPCAYPPNRFRLSKNDSIRFSSVSFDTADSSILEGSRRTSSNVDLASPALPPCPTFAPFSANDVGWECDRRSFASNTAPCVFPANSLARRGERVDSRRSSPRRSLTACSPTRSSERASPPPRRSESLSARQSRDYVAPKTHLDLDHIPPLNARGRNTTSLPHCAQMQRHSMHSSPRRDNDPFGAGTESPNISTYSPHAPGKRASGLLSQHTSQSPNGHSEPPLPSALKGSGHRKGHKRQNCVRISIHPPITFPGPAFSPTVEEPEEAGQVDARPSDMSVLPTQSVSCDSSVSPLSSTNRASVHNYRPERPISRVVEGPAGNREDPYGSPTKKRRQMQTDSGSVTEKSLPGILTSFPTTTDKESLSHTPSPERNPPVWKLDQQISPTQPENSPAPRSPRRSVVMGPRSQPGKPARNSHQPLVPLEDKGKPAPPSSASLPRKSSIREPSRNPTIPHSLRRTKSEAKDQTPPYGQRQSDKKRASHYTTKASPGAQTSAIVVPIWEDQNKLGKQTQATPRTSTISFVHDLPQDQTVKGDVSPQRNHGDRMTRMSSNKNSQYGCTTPAKKTIGLGIGTSTPGSLYDRDGFLKE
ncbi:hypothetical protein BJX61DRAFT_295608 [Aspergillus egyptiacus]|nr:hypothetical protein BJX61DRAFT_295608 [Aspergillus egyptiacus]